MATLSVRCMTNGPLPRVREILALYRDVADEVICIVNSRFRDDELSVLRDVADDVIRAEMGPGFSVAHYRAWERKLSSDADWVLVIDHDEVPSLELLRQLPTLLDVPHVVSYRLNKRWLYPDSSHWLGGSPWSPNLSPSLIRNDPNLWHFNSKLHEGTIPPTPCRDVDAGTYHLDCITTTLAQRREKIDRYRQQTSIGPEVELDVTEMMYLPEQYASQTPIPVPDEDSETIDRVLQTDTTGARVIRAEDPVESDEGTHPGTVSYRTIAREWPGRKLDATAYNAKLSFAVWDDTDFSRPIHLTSAESRRWGVTVENTGIEVWPRLLREPPICLGTRWRLRSSDGLGRRRFWARLVAKIQRVVRRETSRGGASRWVDGPRAPLEADLHPGESTLLAIWILAPERPGDYDLLIDVVHEGVRWFNSAIKLAVVVEEQ